MSNVLRPMFTLSVRSPFFEQIRSGQKTIEGRPFTSKYTNLVKGDRIKIINTDCASRFICVEIARLTRYSSFLHMLKNEGLPNCLPSVTTLEEGIKTYHSFPDYKTRELQYGVIAIAIKTERQSSETGMSHLDKAGPARL